MSTFYDLPEEMQRLVLKYFPMPVPKIEHTLHSMGPNGRYMIRVTLNVKVGKSLFQRWIDVCSNANITMTRERYINELRDWDIRQAWYDKFCDDPYDSDGDEYFQLEESYKSKIADDLVAFMENKISKMTSG